MSVERQPKWRTDFPIRWGADNYVTRREFTKFLVLTSGATFVGNGYFALHRYRRSRVGYPTSQIAAREELAPGQVKLFRYPTEADPALLIRLADGNYVAFKLRCTHLSCPVNFIAERGRLECPCHNGAFDAATGEVLAGPPPRPLPKIKLRLTETTIYAEGVELS